MYNLIRFIERYQFFLLFLVFEIFSFWLLKNHTYYQQSKIENVGRSFAGYFNNKINNASLYFSLGKTSQGLTTENIALRNRIAILEAQLEKANATNTKKPVNPNFIYQSALVINNSTNKQYNYITLNKGTKDGVKQEMGVVTSQGVVGIVAGVSENYSTVISLLNVDLKISAKLKRSKQFGSLYWDGKDYRNVVLSDIPQHVIVAEGDTVVTSGFSSIFPPDIELGTIKSVESTGSNFHTIKVHLFTDFRQLHSVWVVNNNHSNERVILEKSTTLN